MHVINKYSLGSDALGLISDNSKSKTHQTDSFYNMIHGQTAKLNVALQSLLFCTRFKSHMVFIAILGITESKSILGSSHWL